MINIENSTSINMSQMAKAKSLSDLWEDETEAFLYGLNHGKVINYLNNANIRKRNYAIYSALTSIMLDTLDYRKEIQNLIDSFPKEESKNFVDLANYVLEHINMTNPEDKLKIAYVLGKYVRYTYNSH